MKDLTRKKKKTKNKNGLQLPKSQKSFEVLNNLAKVYIQNPQVLRNADLESLKRLSERKHKAAIPKKRRTIDKETYDVNTDLDLSNELQLSDRNQ